MLRSLNAILGYTILALDDTVGEVDDFYFDDQAWTIRYLVVDTGTWLSGRQVLISPLAIGQPDWESRLLPVTLERERIENSPDIDTAKPISRQQETQLVEHYQWPTYWRNVTPLDAGRVGMRPDAYLNAIQADKPTGKAKQAVAEKAALAEKSGDPHLRSAKEVIDYHIQGTDGEIGHVEDFIVDDETWIIRYIVVDTRNWLPGGKKVLVAPAWVNVVSWADGKVYVDLPQESIKNSPEFDPNAPVNREYEIRLYDYHGRPKYWLEQGAYDNTTNRPFKPGAG